MSFHTTNAVAPGQLIGANFPVDAEGRTYHLAVKKGEVANRIVIVGDLGRAKKIAEFFDKETPSFCRVSTRGFAVHTGTYKKVPVSVIGTGMGIPMIDFSIRECRAIIDGKMVMVRLGTCGSPLESIEVGDVVVASKGSILIRRNPDAFYPGNEHLEPYQTHPPVLPDAKLSQLLSDCLKKEVGEDRIREGLNATADSFYSSQGRTGPYFDDRNEDFFDRLKIKQPDTATLEMETYHLFDLARCSRGTLVGSACCIVLAQRYRDTFIDLDLKHQREEQCGRACLDAIIKYDLAPEEFMDTPECVWNVQSQADRTENARTESKGKAEKTMMTTSSSIN